jgi:hypothetical protein
MACRPPANSPPLPLPPLQIRAEVERLGVSDGFVNVLSRHTTTAVTINECEPRLLDDIRQVRRWRRQWPRRWRWRRWRWWQLSSAQCCPKVPHELPQLLLMWKHLLPTSWHQSLCTKCSPAAPRSPQRLPPNSRFNPIAASLLTPPHSTASVPAQAGATRGTVPAQRPAVQRGPAKLARRLGGLVSACGWQMWWAERAHSRGGALTLNRLDPAAAAKCAMCDTPCWNALAWAGLA